MHSCLYEGSVWHSRTRPLSHQFRYRLAMAYLDLDELPEMMRALRLLGQSRFAPAAFRREDHFGRQEQRLCDSVRALVRDETGLQTSGPIRLLTQLRYFGNYFSPLNLFFCFDCNGESIDAIVAEVSNTPWRERHCYVLWEGNRDDVESGLKFRHPKEFHVSPFMDMNLQYLWHLTVPDEKISVHLSVLENHDRFFTSTLDMSRCPISDRHLARLLMRYPMMTAQIVGAIYYQAMKLWIKKCPFYPHPNKQLQLADH